MSQLALDLAPRARRTDPASSHAAASRMARSGALGAQAARVLAAIRATPGLTSRQLSERNGLDRHMVARRCSDLERSGLVEREAQGEREVRWSAK